MVLWNRMLRIADDDGGMSADGVLDLG